MGSAADGNEARNDEKRGDHFGHLVFPFAGLFQRIHALMPLIRRSAIAVTGLGVLASEQILQSFFASRGPTHQPHCQRRCDGSRMAAVEPLW
jgi:hypothetical protein